MRCSAIQHQQLPIHIHHNDPLWKAPWGLLSAFSNVTHILCKQQVKIIKNKTHSTAKRKIHFDFYCNNNNKAERTLLIYCSSCDSSLTICSFSSMQLQNVSVNCGHQRMDFIEILAQNTEKEEKQKKELTRTQRRPKCNGELLPAAQEVSPKGANNIISCST